MRKGSSVLVLLVVVFVVGVAAAFAGVRRTTWEQKLGESRIERFMAVPEPTTLLVFGVVLAVAAAGGRRIFLSR